MIRLKVGCRGRGRYKPLPPIGYTSTRGSQDNSENNIQLLFPPLATESGFLCAGAPKIMCSVTVCWLPESRCQTKILCLERQKPGRIKNRWLCPPMYPAPLVPIFGGNVVTRLLTSGFLRSAAGPGQNVQILWRGKQSTGNPLAMALDAHWAVYQGGNRLTMPDEVKWRGIYEFS